MTERRGDGAVTIRPCEIPAGRPVAISILRLHYREDVYRDPLAFRPERWLGRKPGTYEWIPLAGGTRHCPGAALSMTEMREIGQWLDLEADRDEPERPQHRNVTMIPARGGRVMLRRRCE